MPLLKEDELDTLVHKYEPSTHIRDGSLSNRLFRPLWNLAATTCIPSDVSPNALSLSALLCLLQATYLCYFYYDVEPKTTTIAAGVLIFAFWTLDSLDAIHAENSGSNTSLTLVFDSFCSSVGTEDQPMPLLKEDELDTLVHKYEPSTHIRDGSLSNRLFRPLWNLAATTCIPSDVSPNALSLSALLPHSLPHPSSLM